MKCLVVIIALIPALVIIGCGEKPCEKAEISFRFIGFSDTEASEFTIRRFGKGSSLLVDSVVISSANPVGYYRFGDTLILSNYPPSLKLKGDSDYEFYFPRVPRTMKISAINEPQSYTEWRLFGDKKNLCTNTITGYTVDRVATTQVSFPNTIYLRK